MFIDLRFTSIRGKKFQIKVYWLLTSYTIWFLPLTSGEVKHAIFFFLTEFWKGKKGTEIKVANCLSDSGDQKSVNKREFLPQFSHQLFLSQKGKCWPRSFVCVVPETDQLPPFPEDEQTRKTSLKVPYDVSDTKILRQLVSFGLGYHLWKD